MKRFIAFDLTTNYGNLEQFDFVCTFQEDEPLKLLKPLPMILKYYLSA